MLLPVTKTFEPSGLTATESETSSPGGSYRLTNSSVPPWGGPPAGAAARLTTPRIPASSEARSLMRPIGLRASGGWSSAQALKRRQVGPKGDRGAGGQCKPAPHVLTAAIATTGAVTTNRTPKGDSHAGKPRPAWATVSSRRKPVRGQEEGSTRYRERSVASRNQQGAVAGTVVTEDVVHGERRSARNGIDRDPRERVE
jgi:hypothetical protein